MMRNIILTIFGSSAFYLAAAQVDFKSAVEIPLSTIDDSVDTDARFADIDSDGDK